MTNITLRKKIALVCVAVPLVENKWKLDDPGAISVHGFWGVLSLGLFADGSYGDGLNGVTGGVCGLSFGDGSQLIAQLIALTVLLVFGFGGSYVFFKILDKIWGLRVSPEDELEGAEMGVLAYSSNRSQARALCQVPCTKVGDQGWAYAIIHTRGRFRLREGALFSLFFAQRVQPEKQRVHRRLR